MTVETRTVVEIRKRRRDDTVTGSEGILKEG